MLRNEGDRLTRAVVCSPRTEYFKVESLEAHNIKEVADRGQAMRQHEALRSLLRDLGCDVIDVAELPGHPNSVFTRDTAVVTPRGYVKMSMGIATRKGEEEWMARALDSIGEPRAGTIEPPGTVEGGDVILCGSVAFIGRTRRTNSEGIRQLSHILEKMNYEIRVVQLPIPYLHLDQTIGVFGPQRLIYCDGLFPPETFRGFEALSCPCRGFNVNFICLAEDEIIAPASNTCVIRVGRDTGTTVHALDLQEFAKGTGGPNCLIMPADRGPERMG